MTRNVGRSVEARDNRDAWSDTSEYVAVSEITVPEAGALALEEAFHHRLGAVDDWPGFRGLELLKDRKTPGR